MSSAFSHPWASEVAARLDALLDRFQAAADRGARPVAVFDFDNTCIRNDIGEAFHRYMATELAYALDGPFLEQLHPDDGRARIASLWAAHQADPDDAGVRQALGHEIFSAYDRHMAREGKGPTYQWQVSLLAGLAESRVDALARACIEAALDEPLEQSQVTLEDGWPLTLTYGARPNAEIDALMRRIEAHGGEVWVCSASSRWIVAPFAAHFGVPAERVLAAAVEVDDDGVLTPTACVPHAFSAGKVELIEQHIGRVPLLCAGDSMTDLEMLQHSGDEVLVIDRGDTKLREIAEREGWMIQPAFHLVD